MSSHTSIMYSDGDLELLRQIEEKCHYHPHASALSKLTEEEKEGYSNAVIIAAERLIQQNPDTIFLPRRGGAIHGRDIVDTACLIEKKNGIYYNPRFVEVEASGVKSYEGINNPLKEHLMWLKEKAELEKIEWPDMPKEFKISYDCFTIIDSAFTGMAFRKLFRIFHEAFPDSKINGIVLRDEIYSNDDINGIASNKWLNGGDFFSVKVRLPFEDEDVLYHTVIKSKDFVATILFPTPEYHQERTEIMNMISKKIGIL